MAHKYDQFDPTGMGEYSVHYMVVNFIGKNKRVLEIGCATGYISKKLKENGCHVIGVEIDEEAARLAEKVCDKIIKGDIEEISVKGKFDVIICSDVLEHLKDPLKTLKKLRGNMKDDGKIIVSVPNIANWRIRLNLVFGKFNYTRDGILDESHLRFFTYKTIKEVLKKANLKIIREDITPSFPLPLPIRFKYWLSKSWKTLFALQFVFICN